MFHDLTVGLPSAVSCCLLLGHIELYIHTVAVT